MIRSEPSKRGHRLRLGNEFRQEQFGRDAASRVSFGQEVGGFFSKISKPQILTAVQEPRPTVAPGWGDVKKGRVGTGWLPEILSERLHA